MLHFPGDMTPGQLGPSRRGVRVVALELVEEVRLVLGGDALGDADDEAAARGRGLEDRVGRGLRRDHDERGVRAGRLDGLAHGVVDGDPLDVGPTFARGHAGDHLRPVVAVAQTVEAALAAGQSLDNDFRIFVDEDAHDAAAPSASVTALRAAPTIVSSMTTRSDRCGVMMR